MGTRDRKIDALRRGLIGSLLAMPPAIMGHPVFFARSGSSSGADSNSPASGAEVPWTTTAIRAGNRERYLCAGAMDYFRCPPSLWRDGILKAKRAGLNTIAPYVAWNCHERKSGQFDFSGASDVPRFLAVCSNLSMQAILRVGPFICDGFDAGGYPAWLIAIRGSKFRQPSTITEPYIQRWFGELCRRIAPLPDHHRGNELGSSVRKRKGSLGPRGNRVGYVNNDR